MIPGWTFAYVFDSTQHKTEQHVVVIEVDGVYWDARMFGSKENADRFIADPLAEERARNVKREASVAERLLQHDQYFAASQERISRGRRIGPKPGAK